MAKITDFGLTRNIGNAEEYVRANQVYYLRAGAERRARVLILLGNKELHPRILRQNTAESNDVQT